MDHTFFRWINDLAGTTTWANGVVTFYAKAGVAVFALLLAASYLDARRHDDHRALAGTVWAAAAALVGLGVAQLIGSAVDRARPYTTLTDVHLLVAKTTDFSFPSDHSTVAGAVAVGLLLANRRWGLAAAVAAVLMAFARVYVGAHYPGDVVGGLMLGGMVAVAGHLLVVPLLRRLVDTLTTGPARPLLTSAAARS